MPTPITRPGDTTGSSPVTVQQSGGGSVSDAVYGAGWNGVTDAAPSKNAVYDKIETLAAGSAHTIQNEGTPLTARSNLNFIGAGVAATDNAGTGATDVTIAGGVTDHGALTGLSDDDHPQYGLVASPLSQFAATSSAQLRTIMSDETGGGALVFANSPTLVTPTLGTPASGVLTNCIATRNALTYMGL